MCKITCESFRETLIFITMAKATNVALHLSKHVRYRSPKLAQLEKQRIVLQEIENAFSHQSWEEWYNRTYTDICNIYSARYILEQFYNSSVVPLIMTLFPEYPWKPWKFKSLDSSSWINFDFQKRFFDELWDKLHIEVWKDWSRVSESDIIRNGGGNLLALHESLNDALAFVYPEYPWEIFHPKKDFAHKRENQRKFFDFLMKELQLSSLDDLYEVTFKEIERLGGSSILALYNDSPMKAITTIYPEHNWQFWKFSRVGKGTWNDSNNVKQFLEWAAKELRLSSLEDWYNVTQTQLQELSFGGILRQYGTLGDVLKKAYPDYHWDFLKFREKRGQQMLTGKTHSHLFKVMQHLIPNAQDIYTNYPHPDLIYSGSKKYVELDVFVPSLNLAIEYNGLQHYEKLYYLYL